MFELSCPLVGKQRFIKRRDIHQAQHCCRGEVHLDTVTHGTNADARSFQCLDARREVNQNAKVFRRDDESFSPHIKIRARQRDGQRFLSWE